MTDAATDLAANPSALLPFLRQAGLAQVDETPDIVPLTGGVSSTILKVSLRSGTVCVKQALAKLKVEKDWHAPVDRVFAEIEWLNLAGQLVPGHVPVVLAQSRELRAFVMPYLEPDQHPNWKAQLLLGHTDATVAASLGTVLGTIHAKTSSHPLIAAQFAHQHDFVALRLEPYLLETARQHPDLADIINDIDRATRDHQLALIHGDISPKNILIGSQGAIILDAECATYGDPAFDLAFVLNHLLLKSIHRPQNQQAYQQLFDQLLSTYLPQVCWESVAQFNSRTARLLPALLLARVDGKSPVEYLTEAARTLVRHAARELISAPVDSLHVLSRQFAKLIGVTTLKSRK